MHYTAAEWAFPPRDAKNKTLARGILIFRQICAHNVHGESFWVLELGVQGFVGLDLWLQTFCPWDGDFSGSAAGFLHGASCRVFSVGIAYFGGLTQ
jgi:hypothetical protein